MESFEKMYYEAETFWEGDVLKDPANQERIRATASLIPPVVKTLIDVGCGNGTFVNYLSDNYPGLDLTAVDRSETALKFVRTNKLEVDISSLPFDDHSFDCVTCLEVIEHLPVPLYKQSLRELTRIAKDHVIISVPYAEKLETNYTRCPSCRTIFNRDIHVRNFFDKDIKSLLAEFGFGCDFIQKLNHIKKFVGHDLYRKLFYPEQFLKWQSPICPVCGFSTPPTKENGSKQITDPQPVTSKRKLISYFTGLPKLFWPKTSHYYWILAKYSRVA